MQEGGGLTEVVEIQLLVDSFVDRGLKRLDFIVRHLDQRQGGIVVKNHRHPSLADSLVDNGGFIPAPVDLSLHASSGCDSGETVPASNHSE